MPAANVPEILLLCLAYRDFLDELYSPLFDKLSDSANVKRAKTTRGALRYLEQNSPSAIIVTDEGLTQQRHREVLERVVTYTRNGGLVIVGLHFTSFTERDVFNRFFNHGFGLPWERGDYHRTDFEFNASCVLPRGTMTSSLPGPCNMKTLHVKNVQPHEKIFGPVRNARTQSHVFPPEPVDSAQAAVAGASVGNGYLVYCGDVNGEDGSNRIILSLCGLSS
ncbi:hypothetical protein BDV28DRAFT_146100 [Aspergillus coremiiformis]|uniref:Uncharacterized protein n=1 Tax=Aspergillus coremiiformis TaxID=138285 RepID=A0A5N6ZEU5_9EURO|nr:hypothetical protein BDV28DRAFT_146100 [Aspergillus coremiiformis]